jgi:hypothetical protein
MLGVIYQHLANDGKHINTLISKFKVHVNSVNSCVNSVDIQKLIDANYYETLMVDLFKTYGNVVEHQLELALTKLSDS